MTTPFINRHKWVWIKSAALGTAVLIWRQFLTNFVTSGAGGQTAMTETALKQTAMANRPAARAGAVPGWTRSRLTAALWTFVAFGLGWIWGLLWVGVSASCAC